jgi:hypothetical protein
MGITVQWDNDEKAIIRQTFNGRWTWDDLYAALDYVAKLTDSVPHRVDAIVDVRQSSMLPGGSVFSFNTRQHADKLAKRNDVNRGSIIVVGANPFLRGLYDTFRGLYADTANDVHFVATLEQGRAFLNDKRKRVPVKSASSQTLAY